MVEVESERVRPAQPLLWALEIEKEGRRKQFPGSWAEVARQPVPTALLVLELHQGRQE